MHKLLPMLEAMKGKMPVGYTNHLTAVVRRYQGEKTLAAIL